MVGDLLLRWMSETGSGTVQELLRRAVWLAHTADLPIDHYRARRWLRNVSALGHCEIDWDKGRWSTAPPFIARLPEADATAVLAGARRHQLMDAVAAELDSGALAGSVCREAVGRGQLPPPATVLIQFDTESDLHSLADRLGMNYVACAAAGIAQRLPTAELGPVSAPPVSGAALEILDGIRPRRFKQAGAARSELPDGLYRWKSSGRDIYRFRLEAQWHHCSLSTGVFRELRRRRAEALHWWPETGVGRTHVGTFSADVGAPLPMLQERALVLCSGLIPYVRNSESVKETEYTNVPLQIARAVASSLGQTLQIPPHSERS